MKKGVLVSAVAALLACGVSTDGSSGPGGSSGSPCTLTVSGATSGRYGCTLRFAVWSSTDDTGSVSLGHSATDPTTPVITAALTFPGEPHAGTYTEADVGATTRMTVISGTASWAQTVGGSAPRRGPYTLVLTRVTASKATADRQVYSFTGTLDATLLPVQGTSASAEVTLHASF